VGKSTLFNRLTKSKLALVDDLPGVTRDRLYGRVGSYEKPFTLIDTGGFDPPSDQAFADEVHAQIKLAMEEADVILFLADGKYGLSPLDSHVADLLRRSQKPVIACVNKIDSAEKEEAATEFYSLGIAPLHFISSAHGYGIWDMMQDVMAALPPVEEEAVDDSSEIRVTLLGRPNVGKSSLLNALVGSPRVVVSDVAGTTRDAIDTPFKLDGQDYVLIDTAGIRKLGKVERGIEKAGVFRSLRSLERAHVAVVVLDAYEGITDQDLRLAGQAVEAYRGLVVVLNKWDLLKGDEYRQRRLKERLESAFRFAPYAPIVKISALNKKGVKQVLPQVKAVFTEYNRRINTGPLNKALEMILAKHQPPMVKGKRLKFYYASQVANRPPTIVLFVNNPKAVHFSYQRYLTNELRNVMGLKKAPLRILYRERSGRKPSKGRS
jgi:GTP-binding protein